MTQSLAAVDVVTALAGGVGLAITVLAWQHLGPDHRATRPAAWAVGAFAALVGGALISAYGWYIATQTYPDTTQLIRGALNVVGLVCLCVYFYRLARAKEPKEAVPEAGAS